MRRISDEVRAIWRDGDERLHLQMVQTGDDERASCKPQCSACCTLLVGATLVEGIAIAAWLMRRENKERLAKFRRDVVRYLEHFGRIGFNVPEHWKAELPCIFLWGSGLCSIYAHRPSTCRNHYVLSDPAFCGERKVIRLIRYVNSMAVQDQVLTKQRELALEHELPMYSPAPIPVVVLWGLYYEKHGAKRFVSHFMGLPNEHVLSPWFWAGEFAASQEREADAAAADRKVSEYVARTGENLDGQDIAEVRKKLGV